MRRVVITGLGIISPIGNTVAEVAVALKAGQSGIERSEQMVERGFRSQIAGTLKIDPTNLIDKRKLRFMGPGAAYAYLSMEQAIADAGLTEAEVSHDRTGIIAGSGGPSTSALFAAYQIVLNTGSPKKIGPLAVPKGMCSTVAANLSTAFKIRGMSYSITSACSTSLHCIGAAAEQIAFGKQDVMFAGGGEELDWTLSCLFDAMGAMSSKFNDTPTRASRAFDAARDGFVIAGGGGIVVLETLDGARARGAKIYAEVTGFAATSDGHDMVAPSGEGGERAMRLALATLPRGRKVSYINAHGTSTPVGDVGEIEAVRRVFGRGQTPPVSSTKSMTGHLLGAAGAVEAIACILAMQDGFVPPTINHFTDDPDIDPRLRLTFNQPIERKIRAALSNTFGFGGHNASVLFKQFTD